MKTKTGMPLFRNIQTRNRALTELAAGKTTLELAKKYDCDASTLSKLKARERDRLEELKLELSQKVAQPLIDNTVKTLERAGQLQDYAFAPDKISNNSIFQEPEQIQGFLSYAGKVESELRKSLGFSPTPTSMVLFQQNNVNSTTIDSSVLATLGKYISSELIDVDHTTE